jgi:outer membrane protein assembly factor BamB
MLKPWALCLAAVLFCAPALFADDDEFCPHKFDWPQWQGTRRNGISQETGLLKSWPKDGPKLLWKVTGNGGGFVTPSVAAGRIFLMGNIDKTEYVICRREKDGSELWKTAVGAERATGGGYKGPRCTPTIDGNALYALGLNGDLVCLNVADGKERWRKDLVKEFGGRAGGWGYTESPLIDGDKVLITPGGKQVSIVALDKTSGNVVWKGKNADMDKNGEAAGYSSIITAEVDGQREYIQFMSRGVVGFDSGGHFLWRYKEPANTTANISTPIFHDNCVFAASGYDTGGGLVKLTRDGDKTTATEVFFTKKMQNHHGGMILLDGHLYGENHGSLCCMEFKTGEVKWQSNKPGKGSIAYADGCLYYRNEGGRVFLIEANPKQYVQLGVFPQPDRSGQNAWAHPVIANGRLYIADQDVLLCYDVKQS